VELAPYLRKSMDRLDVFPTFAGHYEPLTNHCVDQAMHADWSLTFGQRKPMIATQFDAQ